MSMSTRRTLLRASALLPLAGLAWAGTVRAEPQRNRLVIQVTDNDPARWNLVLANTRNAQTAVGGPANIDLEIVAYGPGINMLKSDSVVGPQIAELVKSGVKVVGCENTMKAFKLSKDEMLQTVGYVPAGIAELMKKQQEGWSYVRP